MRNRHLLVALVLTVVVAVASPVNGQSFSLNVTADHVSGQPVGTRVRWTLSASSQNSPLYKLVIRLPNRSPHLLVDYRPSGVFDWTTIDEGRYAVEAFARDSVTGVTVRATTTFEIQARVTSQTVVTPTSHPLIGLVSAPSCPGALWMRATYRAGYGDPPIATPAKPCDGVSSMNFYAAGMRQRTTYWFRTELLDATGAVVQQYGPWTLRTGSIARALPPVQRLMPPSSQANRAQGVVLQSLSIGTVLAGGSGNPTPAVPMANDLQGRTVWYYPGDPNDRPSLLQPLRGGTFTMSMAANGLEGQVLTEIDVAGNVLRSTTRQRVSAQLVARGEDPIGAFHHDAIRLGGGYTAVIASVERVLSNAQGSLPINILGDMIVVLDPDWQVGWVWNPFDHLDVTRRAVLAETCVLGEPGCPPIFLDAIANDWTHTNAVTYSPSDGNLLLSLRNQDWIVKVDFRNGRGDGSIIWRLGPQGDFSIASSDPWPWMSHQHDPRFIDNQHIVVYDNGNTRCAQANRCFSRGQVYRLDETSRSVTVLLDVNLGDYSFALGSAQPLSNGNFHFNSGTVPGTRDFVAVSDEVGPDGSFAYSQVTGATVYRSWRLASLFSGP